MYVLYQTQLIVLTLLITNCNKKCVENIFIRKKIHFIYDKFFSD